jgi:hypothetical protein
VKNQETGDSDSSNIKHQPSGKSAEGKLISRQTATSTDASPAASSACIFDRSQSAENLQVDPNNEKVSHSDSGVTGSESSGKSPTIETIPSVTSPTYPAHCTATEPSRSMMRTGVPFPLHLLRSNSASANDEIMYAWTRSLFGKALADYLAGEFGWQISGCQNFDSSHERDHDPNEREARKKHSQDHPQRTVQPRQCGRDARAPSKELRAILKRSS